MTNHEGLQPQTLEDFLEEDLPFLINSHYDDTIVILKQELAKQQISLELAIAKYPNFLTRIRYHLYFFFAHQMSNAELACGDSLHTMYHAISMNFRNHYIHAFVENQIKDSTIRAIIQRQRSITTND